MEVNGRRKVEAIERRPVSYGHQATEEEEVMPTGIDWTPARIRQFRTSHHFTLSSFGRAMGATGALEVQSFSRQAIHNWETGVYPPSTEALRSLDVLAEREDFTP